jgi:hypothetical protein
MADREVFGAYEGLVITRSIILLMQRLSSNQRENWISIFHGEFGLLKIHFRIE